MRKDFTPYLRCLADRMGLRDWAVGLSEDLPSEGNNAQVDLIYGRKIVLVLVSNEFLNGSPARQRQTLCHELVHALFAQSELFLREEMPRRAFMTYRLLSEYGIDAVADVIAPFMPLPGEVRAVRPRNPRRTRGKKT